MRVTLVGTGMLPIPPTGYGAVEKHIWHLAGALEELGHETRIIHQARGQRSRHEYAFALWARKKVAAGAYDVLHLHTPGVAAVFGLLGPRRFVYTTHSRHWMTVERPGERVGLALERRAVGNAQATIAVSEQIAAKVGASGRVHVVPNGVDTHRYRPRPEARNGGRLVGLGVIAPHKQWHIAARAVEGTPWRLTLVGPVQDEAYRRQVEAAAPGRVRVLGVLPEDLLTTTLGESDALVHPSRSEGLPMAVIEGMSAGLPVIGGPALAGLVAHERTGLLVGQTDNETVDVGAFRQALRRLAEDPPLLRAMGENARREAVDRFDWLVVARSVVDVYERAAAQNARA